MRDKNRIKKKKKTIMKRMRIDKGKSESDENVKSNE